MNISFIIPVYNAEKNLLHTTDALSAQTFIDTEFILVNDGSLDASAALCDSIAERDNRYKVIHKSNGGVSSARNTGIDAATGKYLMFCDADDIPHPKQAEMLYKKAEAENADITLCGFSKQTGATLFEEKLPFTKPITDKQSIIHNLIMPMCIWSYAPYGTALPGIFGSVWRGLYKTSLIKNNSISFPPQTGLGEDMVFNILAFSAASKIAFVPESLYTYIENPFSATHTNYEKLWAKYLNLWNITHDALISLDVSEADLRWHNFQLTSYAVNAIIEGVCSLDIKKKEKEYAVKSILTNTALTQALKNLPTNLSKKTKLLCTLLNPKTSSAVLYYYQKIYNSDYRR